MSMNVKTITTGLGIKTKYYEVLNKQNNTQTSNLLNSELDKISLLAVDELKSRYKKPGQFLKWIQLPQKQLGRVSHIYKMAQKLKNQSNAPYLSVIGIGGSKHPIEHMLSINGLNLNKKIKFMSDIDTVSHNRFLASIDGDIKNTNFLVVSKSGTTFEPKDALLRYKNMLVESYIKDGHNKARAEKLANKHFVVVTDKNENTSELRRTANKEGWLRKLYIHDDVGGRFSAFDDHTLFTLAYAGMKPSDINKMLTGAREMSKIALTKDLKKNDPLAQAAFWIKAKINDINTSVHQYLGNMFEDTTNWHAQMQNESIKNTLKQIAKVPDAMHHSAEAHFNPANKYAFALTSPNDKGLLSQNVKGYVNALNKSYSNAGPHFNEIVNTSNNGLTPQAAGALTQSRAFSTVYQEIIEALYEKTHLPPKLKSILQPFVETYKANLKPNANGEKVVDAGRILNKNI